MDNHDLSLHDQQFKNTYLKSFSQKKKKKTLRTKQLCYLHLDFWTKIWHHCVYTIFFLHSLLSPLLHQHTLCYPHLRRPQPKPIILVSLPLLCVPYFFIPLLHCSLLRLGYDRLTIDPLSPPPHPYSPCISIKLKIHQRQSRLLVTTRQIAMMVSDNNGRRQRVKEQ